MKHIPTLVIGPLLLAATTTSSLATTVTFGGETYDTVDWISADTGTDEASGISASNTVDFSTTSFAGGPPVITVKSAADYASDPSFDALAYGGGDIESLDMFAIGATTTITLANSVDSLLLFIGTADGFTPGLNDGKFEFGPDWSLSILDTDDFLSLSGNILENGGGGKATGVARVARVDGNPFDTVNFSHPGGGGGGGDGMSLGVAVNQIPEPSSALLGLVGLGSLLARRRRCQLPR